MSHRAPKQIAYSIAAKPLNTGANLRRVTIGFSAINVPSISQPSILRSDHLSARDKSSLKKINGPSNAALKRIITKKVRPAVR
jgi:hypothetical protein